MRKSRLFKVFKYSLEFNSQRKKIELHLIYVVSGILCSKIHFKQHAAVRFLTPLENALHVDTVTGQ